MGSKMSPDAVALWELVRDRRRPEEAIRQAAAATSIGWTTGAGRPDTRRVQTALRELRVQHRKLIATICRAPFGMFVAEAEADVAAYRAQLESRAREVFVTLRAADAAAALRVAREFEFGDPEVGPEAPAAVHGSVGAAGREIVRDPETGAPLKCWCGMVLRGKQQKFCSDLHRDVMNGRRRLGVGEGGV